jgi:hypothetical protein
VLTNKLPKHGEDEVKIAKLTSTALLYAALGAGISPAVSAQPQGDVGPSLETIKTFDTF